MVLTYTAYHVMDIQAILIACDILAASLEQRLMISRALFHMIHMIIHFFYS